MSQVAISQRSRVVQLYKSLIYMTREYPKDPEMMRVKCHNAFMKNKDVTDSEQLEKLINHGKYIEKELQALYMLKKYRTLKRRYYDDDQELTKKLGNIEKFVDGKL